MAVSVLAIGIATLAYAHPQLSGGNQPAAAHAQTTSYQISTLDFVDPSTGWVLAELPTHDFAVLHTTNAGRSWTQQLTGPDGDLGEYAQFFDRLHGVLVLLGPQAVMYRTQDGGRTWSRDDLQEIGGNVISAEFLDAQHGWLLVPAQPDLRGMPREALYRTSDGGTTWVDLGDPVTSDEWAFRVAFADPMRGWLYSCSSGAHAYATDDGGASWRTVALPAPRGRWPVAPAGASGPEQFFVAVHPIGGSGVVAVVVPIAPIQGRSGTGGVILAYPPLTVGAFDGGGSIVNRYRTLVDEGQYRSSSIDFVAEPGLGSARVAADQVELGSADGGATWKPISTPSSGGAVGYAGALDWWWVGAGAWATTSDGGVTWTNLRRIGVPEPLPGSLQVLDPKHAWFAAGSTLEMTEDGRGWRAVSLPPISSPA